VVAQHQLHSIHPLLIEVIQRTTTLSTATKWQLEIAGMISALLLSERIAMTNALQTFPRLRLALIQLRWISVPTKVDSVIAKQISFMEKKSMDNLTSLKPQLPNRKLTEV
jgi:hypothetical protein